MRLLMIIGLVALLWGQSGFAKDASPLLTDYLLSVNEVRSLSPDDQLIYFHFLNYLTSTLEKAAKPRYAEFNTQQRWPRLPHLFFDDAYADKVVAVRLAAASRKQTLEIITNLEEAERQGIPVSGPRSRAAAKKAEQSLDVPTAPMVTPGSICLFGGSASVNKEMADGKILCSRPPGSINTRQCPGTAKNPTFHCESFGLSNSNYPKRLKSELCVSLFSQHGLNDLTERCVASVKRWFTANPPDQLDSDSYETFIKNLTDYIAAYEAQVGNTDKKTLLAYCQDNVKSAGSRQMPECQAVLGFIKVIKEKTGIGRVVEQRLAALKAPAPASKKQGVVY
jgi:hypothetical protein